MDQQLIKKLWQHTDQVDRDNLRRLMDNPPLKLDRYHPLTSPWLMPSTLFLTQASPDLFMSFHHETSNVTRHYHDFFELIYVCQGTPVGVINDQEIVLQTGSLCIMNPNAVHYFKKYSEQEDLVLNIVLAKDIFQKSLFRILFTDPVLNAFFIRYRVENASQPSFLHLEQVDDKVDLMIETLLGEYLNQGTYSQVVIESLLTLIFSFILRGTTEKASRNDPALAEIMNQIYRQYQTIQLGTLARQYNYHPKYLSTILHKHTGQTFRSLITHIRLQNAASYLLYTELSVEQIAGLVGYQERSSFYGAFRKAFGTSPAAYRINRPADQPTLQAGSSAQ